MNNEKLADLCNKMIENPKAIISLTNNLFIAFLLFSFLFVGLTVASFFIGVSIWVYAALATLTMIFGYQTLMYKDLIKFHVDYIVLMYYVCLSLSLKEDYEIEGIVNNFPEYYKNQILKITKEMKKAL